MKSEIHTTDASRRNDLRTVEPHYSAAEVFAALESPYPGTEPETCKHALAGSACIRQNSPEKPAELVSGEQRDTDSLIKSGVRGGPVVPIQRYKQSNLPSCIHEGHALNDDRGDRGARGGDSA